MQFWPIARRRKSGVAGVSTSAHHPKSGDAEIKDTVEKLGSASNQLK
jgi:hypothetical protein